MRMESSENAVCECKSARYLKPVRKPLNTSRRLALNPNDVQGVKLAIPGLRTYSSNNQRSLPIAGARRSSVVERS